MTKNPQTDAKLRLEQVRDEVDAILDGDGAREIDGKSVGGLDDINGVVFGLTGSGRADLRVTQEPSDPPAPLIRLLGEFIDGAAASYGHPPRAIAAHAIEMMEASKDSDEYERAASASTDTDK